MEKQQTEDEVEDLEDVIIEGQEYNYKLLQKQIEEEALRQDQDLQLINKAMTWYWVHYDIKLNDFTVT